MIGGKSVGRIIKQRSGFIKKCFTDATNYCIQFPLDMDVKMKTVLMGACFLIVSIKSNFWEIYCVRIYRARFMSLRQFKSSFGIKLPGFTEDMQ